MRWYDKNGKIVSEIIGKNGKPRKPNIKDAKNNGYFPSVTTILDIMSKPALNAYFVTEALKAAYDNQWAFKKEKNQAITILRKISKEEGEKAANFGSNIHKHIETFLIAKEGEDIDIDAKVSGFVIPVFDYLNKRNIKGLSEKALIIDVDGKRVAGTCDNMDKTTIRDFKTQKTKKGKFNVYDSWIWQLGAYNIEAKKEKGEIIAISSTEEGVIESFTFSKEELEQGANIFGLLTTLFYLTKGLTS